MAYSRRELLAFHDTSKERHKEIVETLLSKLNNKEKLTLAESKFICLGLRRIYKEAEQIPAFSADNFNQCSDFLFWSKYLIYWDSHDGIGVIKDGPNSIVSDDQKKEDVEFLNGHYLQWKDVVYSRKFDNAILQTIANETVRLIKEITDYLKNIGKGENWRRRAEKSLILHSKYLYYQVSEYYEEDNAEEETITLCGSLIVIDYFVYVHTLFGHFAEQVKFGRPGKSYHRNTNVDFRNIPQEILSILSLYIGNIDCNKFNKQYLFFNKDGIDCAIWFRPLNRFLKGGIMQSYLRAQTFYPIELKKDIDKVKNMDILKINNSLSFYIDR